MKKIFSVIFAVALLVIANSEAKAQDAPKKEESKTSTVDAWREAMPQSEDSAAPYRISEEQMAKDSTPKQNEEFIIRKVTKLEISFIEALKKRDAAALDGLLAADFTPVGINLNEKAADKQHFIEWALKSFQLKNYTIENSSVRAFPETAVVTTIYKRQASIANMSSDGDFVMTDVWVKRDNRWQAVSHHISQMPAASPVITTANTPPKQ